MITEIVLGTGLALTVLCVTMWVAYKYEDKLVWTTWTRKGAKIAQKFQIFSEFTRLSKRVCPLFPIQATTRQVNRKRLYSTIQDNRSWKSEEDC